MHGYVYVREYTRHFDMNSFEPIHVLMIFVHVRKVFIRCMKLPSDASSLTLRAPTKMYLEILSAEDDQIRRLLL